MENKQKRSKLKIDPVTFLTEGLLTIKRLHLIQSQASYYQGKIAVELKMIETEIEIFNSLKFEDGNNDAIMALASTINKISYQSLTDLFKEVFLLRGWDYRSPYASASWAKSNGQ